jgi:putative heme-binding domain-containing protein
MGLRRGPGGARSGRGEPAERESAHDAGRQGGAKLFFGHCAPCHGPNGEGGRGPSLARPRLRRAADDQALYGVIRGGVPGTEMPGAWQLTQREVWQVVAYIRTLGRVAPEAVPGEPSRGRELFAGKGNCAQCHTVLGKGGRTGPELSEIGARRSAAYLRASLVDPEAAVPEGFLQVRVVTKDGRRITGIRLNEDTYTIQVRDLSDRLHSFLKDDLKELHKDKGKTPMPSYKGVLSAAELDDITAYLASLRGVS